jgi:hypothetical protein
MPMIDSESLQEQLRAYTSANALHERALEQLNWLDDQGAQQHRYGPALEMRDKTYEALALAALQLAQAVAKLTADAQG